MTPAVFLDRDGTLIEEVGHLSAIEQIAVFPWTADALRRLHDAGFKLVIVSNQAGVARGFFDEAFVELANATLVGHLTAKGVTIDGVYYCPHHPEGTVERYRVVCECRKPRPGMIRRAVEELGLDPSRSFVIGDRWLDVELAEQAGAQGILVRTGHGAVEAALPAPDRLASPVIVSTLAEAVDWILGSRD